jgi:hypothetical protein
MKMITETAQMLSTCLRQHGIYDDEMYEPFNPKHPCNLWIMESRANAEWVIQLGLALGVQNYKIYHKEHSSVPIIRKALNYIDVFPNKPETPFKMAMFPQFMTDDVVHSYRLFYAGAKFRFAKWKIQQPYWWDEYRKFVIEKGLEVANEKDDGVKSRRKNKASKVSNQTNQSI